MRKLALLLALPLAAQITPVPDKFFFDAGKVRVLILTGRNNHEWRVTNPYLREVLQVTGRFDVRNEGRRECVRNGGQVVRGAHSGREVSPPEPGRRRRLRFGVSLPTSGLARMPA